MKVSYNWLKDYLDLSKVSHEELENLIYFHINEIESYKKMVEATNLMIGYVEECEKHPDSDHLSVCQVQLKDGISQIVCGAPNVAKGEYIICALPGAVLPGDFKIKPSKIRGVESNGMLCSLQELGFEEKYVPEEYKNGIYLLDKDAPVGESPLEYLHLDDYILDLELTSNRSDLLSIEGVAYDLGAVLHQKITPVMPIVKESQNKNPLSVEIKTEKCAKYLTRYVANVKIAESPWWLKSRLIASGIRPINNVVDVTNYVLMELGQPLHSFDADKLGNKIVVRNALADEKLMTLDNIERSLTPDDIVITNGEEVLCLGGVMGGLSTEVTKETKNIVLEAAYFDPLSIRKTSSRLQLKSESSTRFERKVDINRVNVALDRAAQLLAGLADGEVYSGVVGIDNYQDTEHNVEINLEKINSVLGVELTKDVVVGIFDDLQFEYSQNGNSFTVTIPSRRMDLEDSYQDIIEDIARIYGYDKIPAALASTNDKGTLTPNQKIIRNIRSSLAAMGLNEVVTYSLMNKENIYDLTLQQEESVDLLMPMSEDRAVMRLSLLNALCKVVAYNKARKMDNLAIYEIGNKYPKSGESLLLSGALCGTFTKNLWQGFNQKVDFFLVKGILQGLFTKLGISVTYSQYDNKNPNFHPGRTAIIKHNDNTIGIIGELHPKYSKENNLGELYVFELDLDYILKIKKDKFVYTPICKYPSVTRDLAIVVNKSISASEVIEVINKYAKKYLINTEVFDVYEGDNVSSDEKSFAIKLTLQDSSKTLETSDVDKVIASVVNRLDYHLKARLR